MDFDRISPVIDLIHRAPLDPGLWPAAMQSISDMLGASISALVLRDHATGTFPFGALDPRSPAAALESYREYYGAIDTLAAEANLRPQGEVVTHEDLLRNRQIGRSEAWNDFYVPWKFEHMIGTYVLNNERHAASLIVYRDAGPAEFTADEYRTMRIIGQHVTTALRCWLTIREADQRAATMTDALDGLATGIILLDRRRKVVWMNGSARDITGRNDGLTTSGGDLFGADHSQSVILQNLLRSVETNLPADDGRHYASLARPSGGAPLLLLALRASSDDFGGLRPAFLILINDGRTSPGDARIHLQQAWKLTKAEAGLACAIAEGKTLQQVSDSCAVSLETVRTHLKRVFHKTGVHSQADLVRLVLTSPSVMVRARVKTS